MKIGYFTVLSSYPKIGPSPICPGECARTLIYALQKWLSSFLPRVLLSLGRLLSLVLILSMHYFSTILSEYCFIWKVFIPLLALYPEVLPNFLTFYGPSGDDALGLYGGMKHLLQIEVVVFPPFQFLKLWLFLLSDSVGLHCSVLINNSGICTTPGLQWGCSQHYVWNWLSDLGYMSMKYQIVINLLSVLSRMNMGLCQINFSVSIKIIFINNIPYQYKLMYRFLYIKPTLHS